MQAGDLVLYRGSGLLGRIIRRVTASPVAHVAIVDPDACSLIAAEGPIRGVSRIPLPPRGRHYVILVPDGGHGLAAAQYAEACIGKHYNWPIYPFLLVRLLWGRTLPGENAVRTLLRRFYTCSELVAAAWRAAGLDPAPGIPTDLVTPADIYAALQQR